jgi:hypothetical protein
MQKKSKLQSKPQLEKSKKKAKTKAKKMMMCLGIATQPFFLSQAMVETFILEKSKSLRMEAACVMVLGIRSSLPKQQKQATLANVLSSD